MASYDANANRLTKTLGGSTDSYSYDDADKLSSITNGGSTVKSYGYDSAGRTTSVTTSGGTTTLAYDYEGRVSSITYPSSATNTFAYNGLDTRVSKVDSAGTATYKRDGAGVTAPVLSDSSAVYTPGISERRSSTTKFYGTDRLGTNSLETNSSQTVTSTKTYDTFGMLQASTGSSASPFGFAGAHGYQEDGDSGLKLLGHRYYDASTGRFLTRDRIKDGRNWYSYCSNNPVSGVDPDGLKTVLQELGDFGLMVWQIPQFIVGAGVGLLSGGINISPGQPGPNNGTTHLKYPNWTGSHITFGPIMVHPDGESEVMTESVMKHEMVHQTQSEIAGWFYLPFTIVGYEASLLLTPITHLIAPNASFSKLVHDGSILEMAADLASGDKNNIMSNAILRPYVDILSPIFVGQE